MHHPIFVLAKKEANLTILKNILKNIPKNDANQVLPADIVFQFILLIP